MTKHSVFALLLLLAAGVSATVFWLESGTNPDFETAFDETEADGPPIDEETADIEAADAVHRDTSDIDATEANQDEAPDRAEASTSGYKVRIVRGPDKKVVANAFVATLPHKDFMKANAEYKGADKRLATLTEKFGIRSRADARGLAGIPYAPPSKTDKLQGIVLSSQWLAIAAWNDKYFGCQWFKTKSLSKDKPIELPVLEDRTLEIRVVDHNQKPVADYPLRLWRLRKKKSASRDTMLKTDGAGRIVMRHFQTAMRSLTQRWAAIPDVIYREPPHVVFSAAELQPHYTLRVPPTGSLEFVVKSRGGRVVSEASSVQLRPTQAWAPIETSRISAPSPSASTKDGLAKFARVGLGVRVKTKVRVGRYFNDTSTKEFSGPMRPGGTLRHEIRLGKDGVLIRGVAKLVDDVAMKPGTAVTMRITQDVSLRSAETAKLDEKSAFSFFVPFYRSGVVRLAMMATIGGRRYEVIKNASIAGAGSHVDLGDVVFDEPQPIVSGIVTDRDKKPIARATIRLYERARDTKGKIKKIKTAVPTVRTDSAGRFALLGDRMSGSFELYVSASGFGSERIPVDLGNTGVNVRLVRLGILSLKAKFKPKIVRRVRLRARSKSTSRSTRVNLRKTGDMSFRLSGLKPDTYRLTLEIDEWAEPIWSREGFVVRSGVQSYGTEIDLRGVLRRFVFTAKQTGSRSSRVRASLNIRVPTTGGRVTSKTYTVKSTVTVVAPYPSVAYRAYVAGSGIVEGRAMPGVTTLVFAMKQLLEFRVPGVTAAIKSLKGSWAAVHFRLIDPVAPAATNKKDYNRVRFESGIRNRSVTVSNDRVRRRFEYPERAYEATLYLYARGGVRNTGGFGISGFSNLNNIQFNGKFSGRLSNSWIRHFQETLSVKVPLGKVTPQTLSSGKPHVFPVSAAQLRSSLKQLEQKVAASKAKSKR